MVVSPSLCGLLPRTSWSWVIVFLCLSTHLASGPLSYCRIVLPPSAVARLDRTRQEDNSESKTLEWVFSVCRFRLLGGRRRECGSVATTVKAKHFAELGFCGSDQKIWPISDAGWGRGARVSSFLSLRSLSVLSRSVKARVIFIIKGFGALKVRKSCRGLRQVVVIWSSMA